MDRDQAFNTTQRPVGLIFGFGVVIGILVGMIIVYQVLSTDVADHLKEYATFKAIGYPQRFFMGIVFEEAVILALLGFIPGVIISPVLYSLVSAAASLPIEMTAMRPFYVLFGTIAMCTISGAIATRRWPMPTRRICFDDMKRTHNLPYQNPGPWPFLRHG